MPKLLSVLAVFALPLSIAGAFEVHVAPGGSAQNPGTAEAPLGTLLDARDALRRAEKNGKEPCTVIVHEGGYYLREPLALSSRDGGEAGIPVVYRAAPGAKPGLLGGVALPAQGFKPAAEGAASGRLPEAARGRVLVFDLASLGVRAEVQLPDAAIAPPVCPELFLNGERMTLARWPNDGWAHVAEVVESGPAPWRNHASDETGTFAYEGERPSRWVDAPAVWVEGYWCFDWRSETIRVANIDPAKRHITLQVPHCYGLGSGNPGPRRWMAVNLLEELDTPGEYFIENSANELYFWPPAPMAGARIVLSLLEEPLLDISEAAHVVFRGFTLESCAGTAVRVRGGEGVRFEACTVRNTGHDAFDIEGGKAHMVTACDIYDTGRAGIRIGGGDRTTLTPCGHEAVNNHIWRVSRRQRTAAYHVHLSGVGVRLAHNLLHDAPHQSIGLNGNDHLIEYNEVHHVGLASDDCGAFYMGRNPSERGTLLRYNFWHHTGSSRDHGSCAVYFDDGAGGQTVFGNVFYKAAGGTFGAVFVHGGHDNLVENCIFVECKTAFRQAPWPDERWREYLKADDRQNKLLKQVDITKPPYTERYPGLEGFVDFAGEPRLNRAYRNVAYNCGRCVQGNWVLWNNLQTERDPGFADIDALDFALPDDSFVYRQVEGFQPIPFGEIGLYTDELRPVLPGAAGGSRN